MGQQLSPGGSRSLAEPSSPPRPPQPPSSAGTPLKIPPAPCHGVAKVLRSPFNPVANVRGRTQSPGTPTPATARRRAQSPLPPLPPLPAPRSGRVRGGAERRRRLPSGIERRRRLPSTSGDCRAPPEIAERARPFPSRRRGEAGAGAAGARPMERPRLRRSPRKEPLGPGAAVRRRRRRRG